MLAECKLQNVTMTVTVNCELYQQLTVTVENTKTITDDDLL